MYFVLLFNTVILDIPQNTTIILFDSNKRQT